MINVRYSNSAYYLRLLNLSTINDDVISLKFDTGAANTVISFEALIGNTKHKNIDKDVFKNMLRKNAITKPFKSASGDDMIGYLCSAKNVEISNTKFEDFYYYLTFDTTRKMALLGDDFISCCNFSHTVNSNILISGFNYEEYEKRIHKDCIQTKELYEIYNEIMELKIISSNGKILSDDEIAEDLCI